MSATLTPVRVVNRPQAYDTCSCGDIKIRTAVRCRACRFQERRAHAMTADQKVQRSFIHRANHAVRVRMGRTDLIPVDAVLPVGPCYHCGDPAPGGWDHLVPLAAGGANSVDNLVPCCLKCNHRKGARSLDVLDAPEWLTLRCGQCATSFRRRSADLRKGQRRGDGSVFCSIACRNKGRRQNRDICGCPR